MAASVIWANSTTIPDMEGLENNVVLNDLLGAVTAYSG